MPCRPPHTRQPLTQASSFQNALWVSSSSLPPVPRPALVRPADLAEEEVASAAGCCLRRMRPRGAGASPESAADPDSDAEEPAADLAKPDAEAADVRDAEPAEPESA